MISTRHDYFHLLVMQHHHPVESITTKRGAELDMTINRAQEFDDIEGASGWSVAWEGGLEAARSEIGLAMLDALNAIRIENPVRKEQRQPRPPEPDNANAITIQFTGTMQFSDDDVWLRIIGDQIENADFTATLVSAPPLIGDPRPELVLARSLMNVSPDRISKLQRIQTGDTWQGEIVARGAGGWSRQLFTGSATEPFADQRQRTDFLAVQQLLRTLVGSEASSVRQVDDALRQAVAEPARSIAVRIEALGEDSGNDYDQIEETAAREWSLRIVELSGVWWGVDINGIIAYELSEETLADLFAPIVEKLVYPIVSTQVQEFLIYSQDNVTARFARDQTSGDWYYFDGKDRVPADNEQIRGYLLRLASLAAERIAEGEAPLTGSDELLGSVQCILPGYDDTREFLTLSLGLPTADDLIPTSVASSRPGATVARGRAYIQRNEISRILVAPTSLLPADTILNQSGANAE